MKQVNYKSDFPLSIKPKEIDNMSGQPFELVFYTKKAVQTYVAKYDGNEYTNCRPTEDGGVVVFFDNHGLGFGALWVDVHVPLTDKDFADGVCNYRSTEPTDIVIGKGATEDLGGFCVDVFPFFKQGADGKSAYDLWLEEGNEGTVADFLASLKGDKGDKITYDDLTEEDKEDLAGHFKLEVVNNLEDGGEDKALSAEMGKRLNEMISEISFEGGGETKLSGKLNLTSIDEIKSAQMVLSKTNEIAFYLVTDSTGKIPSAQSCYNIPSEAVRQLSLTSPNAATNIALNLLSVNIQPIGVNVGDLIALTRVKVKVSDLAASIGVSIGLSGEIEIYQYKILSMNDAKPSGHNEASAGVMGLMSPWDKGQVNKISGIETTANNALPKTDLLPSRWEANMNNALETGVYPWCTLGRPAGSTGAYTCIVNKTSTDDGSFNTVEQTAYGREGELGQVYKRIIFEKTDGTDTQYGDWVKVSTDADYMFEAEIITRTGYDIGQLRFKKSPDNFTNKGIFGLVKVYDEFNNCIDEGIGIITNYNAQYKFIYIGASTYYSGYFTDIIGNGSVHELRKQTISIPNGSITTDKIANGAITADKIAEGVLNGGGVPVTHAIIFPSAEIVQIGDVSSPIGYSIIAINEDESEFYAVPSYIFDEGIVVCDIDYSYMIVLGTDDEGNPIGTIGQKTPTKSKVYAIKSDVEGMIEELESTMITAEPAEGEEVTDYVLMASDVEQILGDSNKPISQAAVKGAINSIESMIVSVINTPT